MSSPFSMNSWLTGKSRADWDFAEGEKKNQLVSPGNKPGFTFELGPIGSCTHVFTGISII